ncbi:MAG: hypothetical protein HY456_02700 [Parcubacteria group bacterium]|nr:hypothetical protein [Parcubacteria group bacterium]
MPDQFENPEQKLNREGNSEIKRESPKDPEVLKNEIEKNDKLRNALFDVNTDRDNRRLDPYFNLQPRERPYIKEFLLTHPDFSKEHATEKDLGEAQNKTLALFFETAAQIVERQPKKTGPLREDTESLTKLIQLLSYGEKLRERVMEERPEDAQKIMEDLLTKSRRLPQEKISPQALREFSSVIM